VAGQQEWIFKKKGIVGIVKADGFLRGGHVETFSENKISSFFVSFFESGNSYI
jgi:hypothetical protein